MKQNYNNKSEKWFPRLCSYLRIQRWRLEAELVNVGEKRSVQLFSS